MNSMSAHERFSLIAMIATYSSSRVYIDYHKIARAFHNKSIFERKGQLIALKKAYSEMYQQPLC